MYKKAIRMRNGFSPTAGEKKMFWTVEISTSTARRFTVAPYDKTKKKNQK